MYSEYLFFPEAIKDQPLYPDAARQLTAKALDGFPVNPLIFHRDASGNPIGGAYGSSQQNEGYGIPPAVYFGASRGCIRLVGIGKEGVNTLAEEIPMVSLALGRYLKSPLTFKTYTGQCGLERSHPIVYRIRHLVVSRKQRTFDKYRDKATERFTLASIQPLVERAIVGGLISQARLLDEQTGTQLESVIGTSDMLGLCLLDGNVMIGQSALGMPSQNPLVIRDLVFSIDLDITGPWYTGHFRSRGNGLIRKERI